eukprot:3057747-Rhodomonas_salina.1
MACESSERRSTPIPLVSLAVWRDRPTPSAQEKKEGERVSLSTRAHIRTDKIVACTQADITLHSPRHASAFPTQQRGVLLLEMGWEQGPGTMYSMEHSSCTATSSFPAKICQHPTRQRQ